MLVKEIFPPKIELICQSVHCAILSPHGINTQTTNLVYLSQLLQAEQSVPIGLVLAAFSV